jgi:hypothetical protein
MGGAQAVLNHSGSYSTYPNEEHKKPVPAVPTYLVWPIWEQFADVPPSRKVESARLPSPAGAR